MEKKYKIVITSYGENPNYEAEKAEKLEKENNNKYNRHMETYPEDRVSRMKEERHLEIMLTEKEYLSIKHAVIQTFE